MIVVDTNAIVHLLLGGARTAEIRRVFRKEPEWAASFLWRSELELQSAIHFALVHSRGAIIKPAHLPMELRNQNDPTSGRGAPLKLNEDLVRKALSQTDGNKAKASRVLGVGRATLYRFMADHPSVS